MPDFLTNRSGIENRYNLSSVHIDDSIAPGRRRYGLWIVPALRSRAELPLLDGTYDRFTVTRTEVGRIDRIAWAYYRDISMWWAIAIYNGIHNPITDLTVGRVLLLPRKSFLTSAIEKKQSTT